jgi:hypothetical protein
LNARLYSRQSESSGELDSGSNAIATAWRGGKVLSSGVAGCLEFKLLLATKLIYISEQTG